MPIECKVSNSATNSIKRLNNDAAVKAVSWRAALGASNVVPTAVLSGVYKLKNLIDAQDVGLTLFWAHDLARLISWLERTRCSYRKVDPMRFAAGQRPQLAAGCPWPGRQRWPENGDPR